MRESHCYRAEMSRDSKELGRRRPETSRLSRRPLDIETEGCRETGGVGHRDSSVGCRSHSPWTLDFEASREVRSHHRLKGNPYGCLSQWKKTCESFPLSFDTFSDVVLQKPSFWLFVLGQQLLQPHFFTCFVSSVVGSWAHVVPKRCR